MCNARQVGARRRYISAGSRGKRETPWIILTVSGPSGVHAITPKAAKYFPFRTARASRDDRPKVVYDILLLLLHYVNLVTIMIIMPAIL